MLKNLMLIVNPFSGRGISNSVLGGIVSRICGGGYAVTVYVAGEFSVTELAADYGKYHDFVVCVGGDGTLSCVVSGLLGAGSTSIVGYIPYGTANDVATTLALPKNPVAAADIILKGTPIPLDIGMFGDRYFTYIAAFGAFADVSYTTPHNVKKALGHFAYVLSGIASVTDIKPRTTKIVYDGGIIEDDFIFGAVTNSTSVAGFVKLDPDHVDLSDGLFEIVLVKQPITTVDFLEILTSVSTGNFKDIGGNVQMIHAKSVKFDFTEPVHWTVDGEDGGEHQEIEIYNCHQAINIIV